MRLPKNVRFALSLFFSMIAVDCCLALETRITVDTAVQRGLAGDSADNCTLGDAIIAANLDLPIDGCTSPNFLTGGPFIIDLPTDSGPYLLEQVDSIRTWALGLPVIEADVIIQGNDNIVQRAEGSGVPDFRLLSIAGDANVSLNRLVLRNAHMPGGYGGAIFNQGELIVNNSRIEQNVGGFGAGIYNSGDLTVRYSTIAGNRATADGGGILNEDLLILHSSLLTGNEAEEGGGLFDRYDARVINSTVSGNRAQRSGGGIYAGGLTQVRFSTVVDNASLASGTVGAGGIAADSMLTLESSLVANQARGSDCSGSYILSDGHNLDNDGTCLSGASGLRRGDQIAVIPQVGPLRDNGGFTFTHLPLSGSPLLDAGADPAPYGLVFDQRGPGFPRLAGVSGRTDIGAAEVTFSAPALGCHFWEVLERFAIFFDRETCTIIPDPCYWQGCGAPEFWLTPDLPCIDCVFAFEVERPTEYVMEIMGRTIEGIYPSWYESLRIELVADKGEESGLELTPVNIEKQLAKGQSKNGSITFAREEVALKPGSYHLRLNVPSEALPHDFAKQPEGAIGIKLHPLQSGQAFDLIKKLKGVGAGVVKEP